MAVFLNPFSGQLIDTGSSSGQGTQTGPSDPTTGPGTNAPVGTVYVNYSTGTIWIKTGTGLYDWTNVTGTGASTAGYHVEKFTLDIVAITNKYIILNRAPMTTGLTRLMVIDGIEQEYNADYQMLSDDGNRRLSWNSLGLDGVLSVGDRLIITYN